MKNQDKTPLNEITRWEIIRRSQREAPERFAKKQFYRAKDFNDVDFEELFTNDSFVWHSRVGDYIVTIAFEGAFQNLYNEVRNWSGKNRWKKITLKMLTNCLSKALDEEDLQVDCTCPDFCLKEDTKVKLLDGNHYTIKELYEKFNSGDDIWVYASDENGDFKPGHVSDVWISGKSNEMIEITLDNGEVIETTPNHLYMLRNGSYQRADELQVGQSLMPMYFKHYKGYEQVMLNSKPKAFASVYKTVANEVLQEDIEAAKVRSGEDIIAIHHSDFNKSNNMPSNLKPMGWQEHYKYHSDHVMENKEAFNRFVEKGHEYWRTSEGRKIKSEHMKKMVHEFWEGMTEEERKEYSYRTHAWQRTDENRTRASKIMSDYWKNIDDETRKNRAEKASLILNGENGEKASKRMKSYWENLSPEEYKRHCEMNRKNCKMARTTDKCIKARRKNGIKVSKTKVIKHGMEIINYLIENNIPITEENYEKYRKPDYPHYNTAVKYGLFDNINHKIKSIRHIKYETPIDVYDLTVDDYNNFLVSAGVMLHNCYRYDYWLSRPDVDAKYGVKQNRPPKVRNVKNNKGYVCKHLLAVLYGKRWVPAAAKAWLSYIKANPELAEELIWG